MIDNYDVYANEYKIKGGDGIERTLYQLEGGMKYYKFTVDKDKKLIGDAGINVMDIGRMSIQNNDGIFEWLVEPNGDISHRRFIKGGTLTGYTNQIVKGEK